MNIVKLAVNTDTNGKGCICAIARQIQLRERVWLRHGAFVYCTTKLTSHSICLQRSDIIEYLLELYVDPKTNWCAFSDSLHGYQPNRNQQNIAFKELAGDVRNSSSKMFTAAMEISHHSIDWFLVQDKEVTYVVAVSTFGILAIWL
ncbi:Hypothetical predicted protein [Paramuricea clavata]|uniref:Uncharacterized protein n=1 Tax=Paramuricea clavata TaxID=317549 RepID=A0A7D9J4X1_PARCT|nr:Hypothetical predicted protein [Paramuricea clavata]